MTVGELIEKLKGLPYEASVGYAWDGEVRSEVLYVWLARGGEVVLSDGDVVYSEEFRPVEAPTEAENRYWRMKIWGKINVLILLSFLLFYP